MNIRLNDNNIEFRNVLVLNGSNCCGKTSMLKELERGFLGELDNFYVNNNRVYKNDFTVLYIGDYNNFATDFKLTKSNIFKKLIYDEIINNINTNELLFKVNNIFNIIDDKINDVLSKNDYMNNLKFDINIDSVDKIIEKFNDIYIDDYLLDEKLTPRSTLRKLLINLVLYQIEKTEKNNIIVLIDDIDTSLDECELFNLIKLLENNNKAKFIITSCRNVYPYVENKPDIYKIHNKKLSNIESFDGVIKQTIIENEYNQNKSKVSLNSFYEENEYLINEEDINYFNKNILTMLQYQIGLLYCNDNVFNNNILVVKNELEKLFLEITYKYLTNTLDLDN